MSGTIRLQIKLPGGETLERTLDQDSIIIGSGPSAALKIDHADVSSMHAIIKRAPKGAVTISDLGSEAGTAVNGQPITDEVAVKSGDGIKLGQVEIELEIGDARAPEKDEVKVAKKDDQPAPEEKASAETEAVEEEKAEAATESKADDASDAPERAPAAAKEPEAPPAAAAKAKDTPKAKSKSAAKAKDAPKAKAAPKAKDAPAKASRPSLPHTRGMPLSASDDIDESLLTEPLIESNQPTAAKHALQVAVHWGDTVIDSAQIFQPRDVTVSGVESNRKADLHVETPLPATDFVVASNRGQEASIVVPAEAKVALRTADGKITRDVSLTPTDAKFPAKAYNLAFGERLVFKIGTLEFVCEYVRGDAELGRGSPMDWYFPRIFIISALIHSFFVVAAFLTPKITTTLTDDLFKNENRFAQMILKAPEKEKKRKKLDLSGSKGGAKHKGDEGKFGKKDKPKKDALASKAGAPRVDPNKREKDRKIAMNAGLLGILKGSAGAGAVSNVFGPGGLGTGINNAMGGLRGTAMGDAGGAGGLGTRGAGAGGGGNSLGIGGLGTHGHGRGTGGYGNIDLGGRGKGETRVVPGRTIIKGALSKQEIGRVIRRNLARFKYCYEKELNSNPNLSGKISIYFTIAPTGSVAKSSIRETSMNDENVERCTLKVMNSLKFPQPRGGGIVVVTYPFVFAST